MNVLIAQAAAHPSITLGLSLVGIYDGDKQGQSTVGMEYAAVMELLKEKKSSGTLLGCAAQFTFIRVGLLLLYVQTCNV